MMICSKHKTPDCPYGLNPSPGTCRACKHGDGSPAERTQPPAPKPLPQCIHREWRDLKLRACEGGCRKQLWCLVLNTIVGMDFCKRCGGDEAVAEMLAGVHDPTQDLQQKPADLAVYKSRLHKDKGSGL